MSVIAVDFDGCLCSNAWPKIGAENVPVMACLRQRKRHGDKIILWTCRSGKLLEEAVAWCEERLLTFDAINDNLPENIEEYGNNCRKVWADEYWDDKSVIVYAGGHPSLTMKGKNGGFRVMHWRAASLQVVRKPLLTKLKRWCSAWR